MSTRNESSVSLGPANESARRSGKEPRSGLLIVNADDWGRDREVTDRTLQCVRLRAVSSVSAMMFMEDSVRAAAIAKEGDIDVGLHLNFTTPFSAPGTPQGLVEHQQRLSQYLRLHRFAQVMYHPGLSRSFKYVVDAQIEEFNRLYGVEPQRLDGHHHMHLCSNVLLGGLLPRETVVRRNFSFQPGEKNFANLIYRKVVDRILARRHRLVDFFFSLSPVTVPDRIQKIFSLASEFTIEVETHPVNPDEYKFLAGGEIFRWTGNARFAPISSQSSNTTASNATSPSGVL